MIQKVISLAAIALSMSSGAIETVTVHETTITAVWHCDPPRALATDATATVRECRWIVR